MKKQLVIQGHADENSFCAVLARHYIAAANQAGSEIKVIDLAKLTFDPVLHQSYRVEQPLEPDLSDAQSKILWAEHLVWIYPNWWGSLPAKLKGFVDRTFLPGFAFEYEGQGFPRKLLKGRSAEIFMTLDTPAWIYRFLMGAPGMKVMKSAILQFCGIHLLRYHLFGSILTSSDKQRRKWLDLIAKTATKRSSP